MRVLGDTDKWFADKGDYTHNLNYNLNKNSIVMDLGGFYGVWAEQIINKYDPYFYILEPIPSFYKILLDKFLNNKKVKVFNFGISNTNEDGSIFVSGDASSRNISHGSPIPVVLKNMKTVLNLCELDHIDLLQVNIEGDEYNVLDDIIETDTVQKINTLQIQFHLGIHNCEERREKIQNNLLNLGYKLNFNYPFVWESWSKK